MGLDTVMWCDTPQVRGLASALPARHQLSQWVLHYSSARHGISLRTLYRRSLAGPCLLIVRDSGGYVFGCFTPMPWKPSPRYYGTGETFVFQLQVGARCLRALTAGEMGASCNRWL